MSTPLAPRDVQPLPERRQPCALVFSDRCDGAFVRVCRGPWPNIFTYQVTARGATLDLHGPPIAHLGQIPARHVVWVGVPVAWVAAKLGGPALFDSHFVAAGKQFQRCTNSTAVQVAVRDAIKQVEDADKQQAEVVESTVIQQVESRRRCVGEEAPWFVPEELA